MPRLPHNSSLYQNWRLSTDTRMTVLLRTGLEPSLEIVEFRGQKALKGMGRKGMAGVLRLRATRFAQDDGFVVVLPQMVFEPTQAFGLNGVAGVPGFALRSR